VSDKDLNDPGVGVTAQEIDTIDLGGYGAAGSSYIISGSSGVDTITLDNSTMWNSMATSITMPSTYTIGAAGSNYYTTGINGNWNNTSSSTVNITGDGIDMAAGTDIKIDGRSLKNFMDKMEERLAILVPDPSKLEKFEALKKAYEHYKLMEKLCQELPKEEE
jgi:hypothetical protein